MASVAPRAIQVIAGEKCVVCDDSELFILEMSRGLDTGGLGLSLRWVKMCRCGLTVEDGTCAHRGLRLA